MKNINIKKKKTMSTKKYYTRAGEEVKMGDVLRRERRGDYFAIIQEFTVLPNSISKLIKKGLIVEREDPEEGLLKSEKDAEYYLNKIFQKSSLDEENSKAYIKNYKNFAAFRSSKEALIALELLKEFQNILEHEYPDPK